MIVVLDACTISNLINVFQDTSLLDEVRIMYTPNIYITSEVIKEVNANRDKYRFFYKDRWDTLVNLYTGLQLHNYLHPEDDDKSECTSFVAKYSTTKDLSFKTDEGEYFSSLLALYISRQGVHEFNENLNEVIFVTDDAGALKSYYSLFHTNQIGKIIDSIDLAIILFLRQKITFKKLNQYISGLIGLYNRDLNALRNALEALHRKNISTKLKLSITSLIEIADDGDVSSLIETLESRNLSDFFLKYPHIKEIIERLKKQKTFEKINFLRGRYEDIRNGLIWAISD